MDLNFLDDLKELEEDSDEGSMDEEPQEKIEEESQEEPENIKLLFKPKAKEQTELFKDENFNKHLKEVERYMAMNPNRPLDSNNIEHNLIIKCNEYAAILDRDELESIVLNPIDYVQCVRLINNQTEINKIDFHKILTSNQIMALKLAGSSASVKVLNKEECQKIFDVCDQIFDLYNAQQKILRYIESRMKYIAPNLSALVGTNCSSLLISAAGGIEALSRMAACNIQVMGEKKQAALGLQGRGMYRGFFGQLEMVQKASSAFSQKLVRMLSTNAAKVAKIDYLRTCLDGSAGARLKEQMMRRFFKIQEVTQLKSLKPIAIPDDKRRARRGGRRFRKLRERVAITEVRKYKGRLAFNPDAAEDEFRETGEGYGMLSHFQGTGKIKLNVKQDQKVRLSRAQQKRLVPLKSAGENNLISGLASSLAFTPVEGMELINPNLLRQEIKKEDNYFKKESGFRTVLQEKKKEGLFQNLTYQKQ